MDDPLIMAIAMMRMFGEDAEQVALSYAEKHRRSGDTENLTVWLQVADDIRHQQRLIKDRNA
jgi:hypothetical protein